MEALSPSQYGHRRLDHGAHVLVVEDDPVTLKYLTGVLELHHYRLTTVTTAREAMAALDRELPDLLMLDLQLPDVYGLEVCTYLRQLLGGEDIPVLVVTVEDGRDGHARSVRAGADDFLRKPILAAELVTRTRSLMRQRFMRRELRADREAILGLHAQKENLLQYVAHDMKNLLGATQATLALMNETDDAALHLRGRERMAESMGAMAAMVKDLLDISIGDQVDLKADLQTLELGPWLEKVIHQFESLAARRKRRFHLAFTPGLQVEADPHLLCRLVSNLFENAIRWAPEGSLIEVVAWSDEGGPKIRVCDQGPGIPPELKDEIFDRFARLKNPMGGRSGRGLGLAFCRLVMTMHGGRIWVEDNEPTGSRFVLELPPMAAREPA